VQSGRSLSTFERCLLPPSSGCSDDGGLGGCTRSHEHILLHSDANVSAVLGHVLSLFYKITSTFQPATHNFLDCFVAVVVLASCVIFQGPE
jgi:hypothetical protein